MVYVGDLVRGIVDAAESDRTLDETYFLNHREVLSAEAIVKTVEAGYGVSFVSRLAAAWALETGSVAEVPVQGVDLRRRIFMVRNHINEANRAVEAFWGFVHDPSNADLLRQAER